MSDPEATQPPKPNTPRNVIAWLLAHPEFSVPAATFALGAVLGAVVF